MSRSWQRPLDGSGRGKSTASQRRGSAPALARWRQVRRATHLEGRSRNRRRCASKAGGRLVRRAISGKLHRPEQQHRGGAGGTLQQSVLWLLRCQSWLFSRSSPRAHSSPALFHGSPAVAAAAEATEAARQHQSAFQLLIFSAKCATVCQRTAVDGKCWSLWMAG